MSPITSPSASVCIPVYNGERFLAQTIRSVLSQTYRDFELVLLDNASTDRTAEIVASFTDPRIRVERNTATVPQAANFNRAVDHCRTPLVKLVCADDLLSPRCLEFQVPPMVADPRIALVASRRDMIDESGRVIAPRRGMGGLSGMHSKVDVVRQVVRNGGNPLGEPAGVMFRREDFHAVGGWQAEHSYLLDLDLWIRLLRRGEFFGLRESLAAFRIGSETVTASGDRPMYDAHRAFVHDLATAPEFEVRPVDRLVGRVTRPAARLRRRTLYKVSAFAAQRSGDAAAWRVPLPRSADRDGSVHSGRRPEPTRKGSAT
jgi:glycosyltransferase involved in cell wall biosynthesis